MNVLLFVMSMLMLLSLMTYTRLNTFRNSEIKQLAFTYYMKAEERKVINEGMVNQYDTTKGSTNTKTDEQDKTPKVNATRRIPAKLLINSKERKKKEAEWQQTKRLLLNLIDVLYRKQSFYQEAIKENSQAISQLIDSIVSTIDALDKESEIKNIDDLSTLQLPDPAMHELFYRIMKGSPPADIVIKKDKEDLCSVTPPQEGSEDGEEGISAMGYYSLFNFIDGKEVPIRVYLASQQVLEASFPADVAEQIIQTRNNLYKQAKAGQDKAALSNAFQSQFAGRQREGIDLKLLNFTVTETNPK
jgi:hypothetical protein